MNPNQMYSENVDYVGRWMVDGRKKSSPIYGRMVVVVVVDGRKKSSRILLNFFSDEVQVILMCGNLEILRKTFFIGKKSNFNFQKVGVFWSKKKFSDFSQNFVR